LTPADETRPALKFYYHELDEYRGLSTLLIHQATEEVLSKLGLYPLLYYANGILYVGPEGIGANTDDLCAKITTLLFTKIRAEAQPRSLSVAKDACDPRKGMKIEKYAYLFCSLQTLFDAGTNDEELVAKVAGNILKRLERISGGATPTYGEARVEAAQAFAELIVRRLFRELCHGSVSKLTHQENAYADAIYFFTAQQIHARWEQYKQQKAQRVHETNHSSKVSRSESDLPSNIL
jgi:hypothetical protein